MGQSYRHTSTQSKRIRRVSEETQTALQTSDDEGPWVQSVEEYLAEQQEELRDLHSYLIEKQNRVDQIASELSALGSIEVEDHSVT